MSNRAEIKQKFIDALVATGKNTVTKSEIKQIATDLGIASTQFFTKVEENKIGRGLYKVPNGAAVMPALQAQVIQMPEKTKPVATSGHAISNVITDLDIVNLVPNQYKNYVPFGNFEDVLSIVKANRFFPVFITGHSGNEIGRAHV